MSDSPSALSQQAIEAALSSNWEKALTLNQQILEVDPKNVEAINRAARANFELGDLACSKKMFEQALEYDPYNQIAAKFLKRIETCSKKGTNAGLLKRCSQPQINCDLFIEEPGKTQVVTLLKVAEPQKLSLLSAGMAVNLVIKNRGVSVTSTNDEYLGVVPDDLSHRLLRLIKGGNKYQAYIKTTKTNSLSILIHEIYRSARFKNQPSFVDGLNTTFTYSSNNIILSDDDEETYEDMGEEDEST